MFLAVGMSFFLSGLGCHSGIYLQSHHLSAITLVGRGQATLIDGDQSGERRPLW